MQDILHDIRFGETIHDVMERWAQAAYEVGVTKGCYHFTPAFKSQVGGDVFVALRGYSDEWTALYTDPELRQHNPIPDFVMKAGRIMTWEQVVAAQKLTKDQRRFLARFTAFGHQHGFSIPLYGPNGRQAYSSYCLDHPVGNLNSPEIT
jgi:Autoinducer binding domain